MENVEQPIQPSSPEYRLYDPVSVALATFFGSPVMGGILMALNFRKLGQRGNAIIAVCIGIAVTGLIILLGAVLPHGALVGLTAGVVISARILAKSTQGPALDHHLGQGGQHASRWSAVGLGIVGAVMIIGLGVGGGLMYDLASRGPRVVIGSKDEIYYSGKATEAEARSLGASLQSIGYMTDQGVTVLLSKGSDGTIVSFVVKDEAWNQPDMISNFENLAQEIGGSVGGLSIKIRLVDSELEPRKELPVQ
jgi:hypothetical protein